MHIFVNSFQRLFVLFLCSESYGEQKIRFNMDFDNICTENSFECLIVILLNIKTCSWKIDFLSRFNKPPMHQDRPRFSTRTSHKAAELAAVALVKESPTAATISISPRDECKSNEISVILLFFISSGWFFGSVFFNLVSIHVHFLVRFCYEIRESCTETEHFLVCDSVGNFQFVVDRFHLAHFTQIKLQ